jgi:ABC-type polysaccharide/polyol phosphate export permease
MRFSSLQAAERVAFALFAPASVLLKIILFPLDVLWLVTVRFFYWLKGDQEADWFLIKPSAAITFIIGLGISLVFYGLEVFFND